MRCESLITRSQSILHALPLDCDPAATVSDECVPLAVTALDLRQRCKEASRLHGRQSFPDGPKQAALGGPRWNHPGIAGTHKAGLEGDFKALFQRLPTFSGCLGDWDSAFVPRIAFMVPQANKAFLSR